MFKKLLLVATLVASAFALSGCNEQIPAGHKGKILGKTGFQPEIFPPSKVWLENNPWNFNPEQLFLVQTTTKQYSETVTVLLQDKLELRADIRFRGRITTNDKVINTIFNDLQMNDNVVTTDEVYETYGKMLVRNVSREVIARYNVEEVNKNYARITAELYTALKPKLKGLPIEISDIALGNIKYPDIVTTAIEAAKERQMAIEKEEAQVQIELARKTGQEQLAEADYRIKMMEAKRINDYNNKISKGVTKDLLELRRLELRELELAKWDGRLPTTLMTSGASSSIPVIVSTTK